MRSASRRTPIATTCSSEVRRVHFWTVDGLGEIELRPGDTMYIPAGTRHSAASTESASLHLTIGILS